ncbi:MerR family transcriptional regulator [Piscinibacter sp. HJYY11]|uniref:MerR family transcriptional regulator n=1 Tax=Piscinibacter sp. HJYY11 TaxID=2801333 RepID=UPI00191CB44B|nr:MerR family transcriptional regulator [Piscinibacter sp. HJYY11]MBL0726631.1 MerR family transcriptional regulator [Piscinibacter sp. HJYY11]
MGRTKSSATGGQGASAGQGTLHRSGAVARMLRMPVATLRVWERRYSLTQPQLSPSGQRLYSGDDVRRLALIKQLTEVGHAIGSLAALDMAQLQRVASTHAQTLATTQGRNTGEASAGPPARAWRLAVIGPALGLRLRRPGLLRRLGRPVSLLGPYDTAAQAAAALTSSDVDAVLLHEPRLHDDWLAALDAAAPSLAGVPKLVLYGFAADAVCEALANAGATLLRGPQPDAVLAQWLNGLAQRPDRAQPLTERRTMQTQPVPPRRWDDAALADFASLSTTVACECPRHVSELLVQLSHFEAYSAECEHRSVADAQLHAYVKQVAAQSRALFEAALEQLALHEGLLLPGSSG